MTETAIVIDDDELVNESLSSILEIMEIKVVGRGYDGKQAIDLYEKHNPDYTLIDLAMPNYDGFFAIENIRRLNKNARLFIVTGDTTSETKKKLENMKITGLIYKPYKINTLLEILRSSKNGN